MSASGLGYRKHVERIAKYAQELLFLHGYQVWLSYDHELDEDTFAQVRISLDYLTLTIEIGKQCRELYERGDAKMLFSVILHEFCHVIIEPISVIAFEGVPRQLEAHLRSTEERATQQITNVLMSQIPSKVWKI